LTKVAAGESSNLARTAAHSLAGVSDILYDDPNPYPETRSGNDGEPRKLPLHAEDWVDIGMNNGDNAEAASHWGVGL